MAYSVQQRRTLRRKYGRRPPPRPEGDPDGMWLRDPDTGREVFMPFLILHQSCRESMDDSYIRHFEDYGIMRWRRDPTYNLRGQYRR